MIRIELMELNESYVRYKYFPENSEEYGIVMLNRETGERSLEKVHQEYGINYAAHALKRMEEYQKNDEFPPKDIVAWY